MKRAELIAVCLIASCVTLSLVSCHRVPPGKGVVNCYVTYISCTVDTPITVAVFSDEDTRPVACKPPYGCAVSVVTDTGTHSVAVISEGASRDTFYYNGDCYVVQIANDTKNRKEINVTHEKATSIYFFVNPRR